MGEVVAIVGSRQWRDGLVVRLAVRAYVEGLPYGDTIVTGGAAGVDFWAEAEADAQGIAVEVIRPDYAAHGKRAPLVRNAEIARRCTRMVAFWNGRSRGTAHAIAQAVRLGRPVEIENPDPR